MTAPKNDHFTSQDYGPISLMLRDPLGPIERWAFATGDDDVLVRTKLYEMIDPVKARAALAHAFPSGTARAEIERRLALQLTSKHEIIDEITAEIHSQATFGAEVVKRFHAVCPPDPEPHR
jgi:hypothetical protein